MITSLNQQFSKIHRRGQVGECELMYLRLHDFIEKVNQKINNRIQLVQQVYLDDYKEQMIILTEELKGIQSMLDMELLKQRSNEKLFILEEERDFFRTQVLKLNEEVNTLLQQNKQIQACLYTTQSQLSSYKTIAFKYEVKFQKIKNQKLESLKIKRDVSLPNLPNEKMAQTQNRATLYSHKQTKMREEISTANRTSYTMIVRPNYLKTVNHTKHNQTETKYSLKKYEQSTYIQKIIDDCIKEVKKQIYFRTLDTKDSQKMHFEEFGKVAFDKFTKTDKKELVAKILQNQRVLEDFNEFLISRLPLKQSSNSRLVRTKLGDDKYNEKFLSNLKQSFNKRIFDLKSNRS